MSLGDDHCIIALDIGTQNQSMSLDYQNFHNNQPEQQIVSITTGSQTQQNKESSTIFIKIGSKDVQSMLSSSQVQTYKEYESVFSYNEMQAQQNGSYCVVRNYKQDFCQLNAGDAQEVSRQYTDGRQLKISIPLKYLFTFNYFNAFYRGFCILNQQHRCDLYKKLSFAVCVPAQSSDNQRQILLQCTKAGYHMAVSKLDDAQPDHQYIPPQFNESMIMFLAEPECGSFHDNNKVFINDGERFMVVDCGAGTFDISVFIKNGQKLTIEAQSIKCAHGGADMQEYIKTKFFDYLDGNKQLYEIMLYQLYQQFQDYPAMIQFLHSKLEYQDMPINNQYTIDILDKKTSLKDTLLKTLQKKDNDNVTSFKSEYNLDPIISVKDVSDFEIKDLTIHIARKLYMDAIEHLIQVVFQEIGEPLKQLGQIQKIICIGGLFELDIAFLQIKDKLSEYLKMEQDNIIKHPSASIAVSAGAITYYVFLCKNGLLASYEEQTFKETPSSPKTTTQSTNPGFTKIQDPTPAPVVQPKQNILKITEKQYGIKYFEPYTDEIKAQIDQSPGKSSIIIQKVNDVEYISNAVIMFQDKNTEIKSQDIITTPLIIGLQRQQTVLQCWSYNLVDCGPLKLYTITVSNNQSIYRTDNITNPIPDCITELDKQRVIICQKLGVNYQIINNNKMIEQFQNTNDIDYLRLVLCKYIHLVKQYLSFSQTFRFGFDATPKLQEAIYKLGDDQSSTIANLGALFTNGNIDVSIMMVNLAQFNKGDQYLIALLNKGCVYVLDKQVDIQKIVK